MQLALAMSWNHVKNQVLDSFRVCARCGSFSWKPITLFCSSCSETLKNFELPGARTVSDQRFLVYAHYVWNQSSDSVVRPLIYSLKGGELENEIAALAESFSWSLRETREKNLTLVPPPSRTGEPDHALVWANALAKIWNCEVWRPLNLAPKADVLSLSQKHKSRKDRASLEFLPVKIAKPYSKTKLIFVDDVLTTGSTARAAFKALGEPKSFEVWAIAWRPHLAGI